MTRIDDDVFPFSEGELRAALALVFAADRAAAEADQLVRGLRAQRHSHDEFAACVATAVPALPQMHAFPAFDVPATSPTIVVWPELEYLALLGEVSPELAVRVDAHRARVAAADPVNRWAHDVRLIDNAAWRRVRRRIRRVVARSGA